MPKIDGKEFSKWKIDNAIKDIDLFEKSLKGKTDNQEAFAKLLGYKSTKNGAYINRLSDLRKYGLIEKRGAVRITELGRKIIYAKDIRKKDYILEAIKTVSLFEDLIDKIGMTPDFDKFDVYLLDVGFSQSNAFKYARKFGNIYKSFIPYITKDNLQEKPKKSLDDDMDETDPKTRFGEESDISNVTEKNYYKATLVSDGIFLKLPKEQDKIDLVRILLNRLEKEIGTGKKEEPDKKQTKVEE